MFLEHERCAWTTEQGLNLLVDYYVLELYDSQLVVLNYVGCESVSQTECLELLIIELGFISFTNTIKQLILL